MTLSPRIIPASFRAGRLAATLLSALLLVAAVCTPGAGWAGTTDAPISRNDPESMLRVATDRLLSISREARAYAKEDPERYYAAVEQVLDQVVDLRYFARGVMATYASARLYRSLQSEDERQAFRARIDRFIEANKRVFMVKYADAILTFEGERIDLARVPTGYDDNERASVRQTIYDSDGQVYEVYYSLHRVEAGGWLVSNVIVEGVNLGQVYRTQFAEEVEKHRGDVDYVVANWVGLMTAYEATERAAKESGGK